MNLVWLKNLLGFDIPHISLGFLDGKHILIPAALVKVVDEADLIIHKFAGTPNPIPILTPSGQAALIANVFPRPAETLTPGTIVTPNGTVLPVPGAFPSPAAPSQADIDEAYARYEALLKLRAVPAVPAAVPLVVVPAAATSAPVIAVDPRLM